MVPRTDPEFQALIPPLTKEEFEQLEHNIVSCKKCRDAIILWEGVIIDGHNRFEICAKHSISFGIREISFESREDAKVWIIDNQLGRRNLSDAARIELALEKAAMLRKRAKENKIRNGGDKTRAGAELSKTSNPICEKLNVRKELAAEAGVSEGTLYNYMEIQKHANPGLAGKVKSGEMKIGTAHRLLGKEIIKQLKQADGMYKMIFQNLPFGDDSANSEVYLRLDGLRKLLSLLNSTLTEVGDAG